MINPISLFFFRNKLKISSNIDQLISFIDNNSFIPAKTASLSSILNFTLWDQNDSYCNTKFATSWHFVEHSNFTITTSSGLNSKIDIREISALAASKSNLCDFDSLEQMVITNASYLIEGITIGNINDLMKHYQIRTDDSIFYYKYANRYAIINSGGSHHFAAAKYIAMKLDTPYYIVRGVYEVMLNPATVNHICNQYNMFVIDNNGFHYLANMSIKNSNFEFYYKQFPIKHVNKSVIFLPKKNYYSNAFAQELKSRNCKFINDDFISLVNNHN